jgi:hypothetical protein
VHITEHLPELARTEELDIQNPIAGYSPTLNRQSSVSGDLLIQ